MILISCKSEVIRLDFRLLISFLFIWGEIKAKTPEFSFSSYAFSSTSDRDSRLLSILLSGGANEFLRERGVIEFLRPGVVTNLGLSELAKEDLRDLGFAMLLLIRLIGFPFV